jgi:RNA polymerase sigma-70 factor (ECF subfamily)
MNSQLFILCKCPQHSQSIKGKMVHPIEEQGLIDQIIRGDQEAFLSLYDRYAARVHALTLRILGDSMLAEEATQDTFLKVWSRARQYTASKGKFITWLLTIARRTALDRLRFEARRPMLSPAQDPEEVWKSIPNGNSLSEETRWRSLYFTVKALPEEQRQVIELAYYKGMSQSEIAEVLDWPLGTVKTRVRAAMQTLRDEWLKNSKL